MGETINISVEEGVAAVRRGECPFCRLEIRHPPGSRCPHARWYGFLWDCRARVEALFHLSLDQQMSLDDLKTCFERGDLPAQVVVQFIDKYEQSILGRRS